MTFSESEVKSNAADDLFRQKAREAIRTGQLPSGAPDRTFGDSGSGEACALCGEPVRRSQVGFEVEYDRTDTSAGLNRYELHLKCLKAWERERLNLAQRAGP